MTTTDQATRAALRLARSAAQANTGILSCPYPADATGARSAARRVWLLEYLRLRPSELAGVDYGDALLTAAHGPDTPDDGTPAVGQPSLFAEAGQ